MAEAIPELVWFALLLFLFAIVYVCRRLIEALFNPIIAVAGRVPFLGDVLRGALVAVEQSISNKLGAVEGGIDGLMGASWHRFAQLNMWLWREIKGHIDLLLSIASYIPIFGTAINTLRSLVHRSVHANTGTAARVKTLERELHGIEHQVKQLERDYSKGIGHDVLPRLKRLGKELHNIETVRLPAITAADQQAASAISNLYEWVKGKASIIGVGTFTLAVATAIGLDVFNWLRCSSASNLAKKYKCGFWKWIEDALALIATLALAAFSVLKPQALAEASVEAVDAIEPILAEILNN